ncbi:hypothetical protein SAMN02927924_03765 [Sphingobium faniae]|nr:hypothetical protein SAMN02927924_03765 [Sphingobium faniae]
MPGHEEVRLEAWAAGGRVTVENKRGLKFLVLAVRLRMGDKQMEPQSWGQLPAGTHLVADVGPSGAWIWMKDRLCCIRASAKYGTLSQVSSITFQLPVSIVFCDVPLRRFPPAASASDSR